MNISRTKISFDMRFSRAVQKWSPLHSEQVSSKSLTYFLRKSRKTPQKWTFLDFMDDPDFSSKIGLRQFVATIVLQLHAKFQKDPMTGYLEKLQTNGRTNGHGSIYRTNLQSRWVKKKNSLTSLSSILRLLVGGVLSTISIPIFAASLQGFPRRGGKGGYTPPLTEICPFTPPSFTDTPLLKILFKLRTLKILWNFDWFGELSHIKF